MGLQHTLNPIYNFTEHVWLTELAIEKVFDRDFIPIFLLDDG